MPSIAIIGAGKVGLSIAQLLLQHGYQLTIGTRHTDNTNKQLKQQALTITVTSPQQAVEQANIVLLTVPDHAIEQTCQELTPFLQANTIVSHCSGALSSKILASAKQVNCAVASTHPLNSFPTIASSLAKFTSNEHGSYLYTEGDREALEALSPLFNTIGFTVVTINPKDKVLYHTACVFACNYLTALMEVSLITAEHANIDRHEFWSSIKPLIDTTLDNISQHGTSRALSGPIARGDIDTVNEHINQLKNVSQNMSTLYTNLGIQALELAIKRDELDEAQLMRLRALLEK